MVIAMTGTTGNMGKQALKEVLKIKEVEKIKLLILPDDKRVNEIKKNHKKDLNRIEFIFASLADKKACVKLVEDTDYVVNMAAVIPPHSDQHPEKAVECNEKGVDALVSAIEKMETQPKFIHISTLALYGNRNEKHPWVRVGDPLLVSPYDIYSLTKLRGEFRVLESDIKDYAVIRQTAMLHNNMLSDNMSDGLMFHTCFNAPLEWSTAEDSGLLIANIIRRDMEEDLSKVFWHKVFNLGGGLYNCVTGYDVLNDGFEMIGGSVKDFFEPDFNATRNFHGTWFYDSKTLDDLFHYQRQSTKDFWKEFEKDHAIFKCGKIVPKSLIKKFAIKRLFKSPNSVKYWKKHNDQAKLFAYFGGEDKYNSLPKSWDDFNLLIENKAPDGSNLDYEKLRDPNNAQLVDIGYDTNSEVGINELKNIAKMHGGRLLSRKCTSLQDRLEWENSDGEKFTARAYTVMAGHWLNPSYKRYCWDFDRLSKKDKIYAGAWYDSHDKNENKYYYLDKNYEAQIKDIK